MVIMESFKKGLSELEVVHMGAAKLEHATRKGREPWKTFTPTRFVYSYFAFNSLYNVDWNESMRQVKLVMYDTENTSEAYRYHSYIDFCFQDDDFVLQYGKFFNDYVTSFYTASEIMDALSHIDVDKVDNGGIYSKRFIMNFCNACAACFKDSYENSHFNKDNCRTLLKFIYQIRCNIFHGAKTLDEMQNKSQQKRIEIYTAIIIAANQMVFSYLSYLSEGKHTSYWLDDLYREFKIQRNG